MNCNSLLFKVLMQFNGAILIFCCGANSVYAHNPGNDESLKELLDLSLEQLLSIPITTASFFERTSLEVGSTVALISHEDWEMRGARRLHDALGYIPGVVLLPNFLGSDGTFIRGYARTDARGVALLWDGIPLNSFHLGSGDINRPNIQLDTLKEIEVMRGPGSAVYGTDAFFGVVSLKAFESSDNYNRATFEVASNGYHNGSLQYSAAISDNLRLNFSLGANGQPNQNATYQYTDPNSGQLTSSTRDYQYQSQTSVIKLSSNSNKAFSYKLGYYYDNNEQAGFHGQGADTQENDVSDVDSSFRMTKINLKQNFTTNTSIEWVSYYWNQDHVFQRPAPDERNVNANNKENRLGSDLIYRHANLFSNTQLSLALGYRAEEIDQAHRVVREENSQIVADVDQPFANKNRNIKSALLDASSAFADNKLLLHYGFRFDQYSDFGTQLTPRLGAVFSITKNTAVKLLYGNAFRAPTAVELYGSSFINGDVNIQPETIDTYELVFIKKMKNWKTEYVVFANQWSDGITALDTDSNGRVDQFANIAENSAKGVEISHIHYFAPWSIDVSASYVESKNNSDNIEYAAFPKYIVNIGAGYQFVTKWSLFINNRVLLDAMDGPHNATKEPQPLKDYWRMDLNIARAYEHHWQFFANIRNLFDRKNYLPSMLNAEGGIPDESRSVDIGFRYRF